MHPFEAYNNLQTRRQFFRKTATGLGSVALASMLGRPVFANAPDLSSIVGRLPQIAPKAKRAIYISLIGAPSQLDLYDYKPELSKRFKEDLNQWLKDQGQRLTGMTSGQASFPLAPSIFKFKQYGQSGTHFSELLPWTGKMADDICLIKSMHTDAINHEPAILLANSGNMNPGKPSMGSWISYGLGSMNDDLPTFVVLTSKLPITSNIQALSSRLWSSGFLSPEYSGVAMRSGGDPVIHLSDPKGVPKAMRRAMIDGVGEMNRQLFQKIGDPETNARIAQYEMAFRMQTSVPELTDLSDEPESIWEMYGPKAKEPGTYAYNCLMARRMAERGVRFTQIFHRGWDAHDDLPNRMKILCEDIDRPTAALLADLKQRGLLDDTLVVWGGEFGRTVYCQGSLTKDTYGRDHHPRCFSMWMAGGGVKPGISYGETDDFSYNINKDPVHIRDLNATILSLLGVDHERLTFKFQGLDQKLTGTEPETKVVKELFA